MSRPRLQLAAATLAMALTLLCLANLMGVFDGKPDCLNDPIFTLKGTSIDCAAGP